jgi:DNA-binding MarR family transcriptional regulator
VKGSADRRSKELRLTEAGAARLRVAAKRWAQAQRQFAALFGDTRAADLRALLRAVTDIDLAAAPAGSSP